MVSRFTSVFLLFILAAALFGCTGESAPATPKETFYTYSKARKKKDLTAMKLLLSAETLKMHSQEAKAQGVTVDEIVQRETLISESQSVVKVRNEVIEGEKATLEVENSYGTWETVPFVFEDGQWKIDKKGAADRLQQDIERMTDEKLDQLIQDGGVSTPGNPSQASPNNSGENNPQ